MNLKQPLRQWCFVPILLLSSFRLVAQCNAPASLWLVPPQTSTSLVLKWASIPGSNQYQLRYWEAASPGDKTIVDNCGPAPFILRGLKKSTAYTLQVRSKCGSASSAWGSSINASTIFSSGSCANLPTGVTLSTSSSNITIGWTSTGSHTIRYRIGDSGDWLIPSGALSVMASPFSITGLSPGVYGIEIKRNCSATAGAYQKFTTTISSPCTTPGIPAVTPGTTDATITLPVQAGVSGYQVEYRKGTTGVWLSAGNNLPAGGFVLTSLLPATLYQVQIQAKCTGGNSSFSLPASFTTGQASGPCLANKNAGKNMDATGIQQINQKLNTPSPFSFGDMIGVNDGGLIFRSFQNVSFNQITGLTTQFRNFHTMDEDFNLSLQSYDQNIKPKNTIPEGTPAFMAYNKGLYTLYRQVHGFTNITGAAELLQYGPQTWKEKIYKESDWSLSGPAGIQLSFGNYTKKFIDELAPANGTGTQILVSNYQVGNELWDYPVKADYHSMLLGAYNAFISKYGPKSNGGWKMKLVAGAFQAYRDNTCTSSLRDFSNCGGNLERFDFIGDYLELTDCSLLKDLDAIDCHPYSFKPGSTQWTYPEDPVSEALQIRNLAAWLDANQNSTNGVLSNTRLWSTEFGFDSNPTTGVGEKTQSAYLLRGLMLHSRYHFEKVFFYNAYDGARAGTSGYEGLYNSSGFWKQGLNGSWPSPLEVHGASPKPSWFGMLDFKTRFKDHVFYKAISEDNEAYVIMIAKPDGSEPYLVFWSPKQTNDGNVNQDLTINKTIQWSGVLSGSYKVESTQAQAFAESSLPGQTFVATAGSDCGTTTLTNIRRSPAFIRLVGCDGCPNITNPGTIAAPGVVSGNDPFDPVVISSTSDATGGTGGIVEYQWQKSTTNNNFQNIPGATMPSYDPPSLSQTTYFRRGAKRNVCHESVYTSAVVLTVLTSNNGCPSVASFLRHPHISSGCNGSGDNYYELTLNQITANDQLTLSGLPGNGINIPMSTLNGVPFTNATFQSNLNFVTSNSMHWQVKAGNGSSQTLRLFYCWVNTYPNPVSTTTVVSLCSGVTTACAQGSGLSDPGSGDRNNGFEAAAEPIRITVAPNPGTDYLLLTYEGRPATQAILRIMTSTGQVLKTLIRSGLEDQQAWEVDTQDLPFGMYFLCLQTGGEVKWLAWQHQ